jgi:protein gp37
MSREFIWTDATWNPVGGCSLKSPGCINCYAQSLAGTRLKNHPLYFGTTTLAERPLFNGRLTAAGVDDPVWTWPATDAV